MESEINDKAASYGAAFKTKSLRKTREEFS